MSSGPDYHERLSVPLRWWAQGTMFVATIWLIIVIATAPIAWVVSGAALVLLALALFWYGDARVIVGDGWFQAGRARIEAEHLGAIAALDAEQTRLLAGRDADARAFLLLRPYIHRAVKVEVADPADPTPYWLVSSRHPEALADALTALPRGR